MISAGYPIHELIHVDNATSDESFCASFYRTFKPAVQIRHYENLGVAKGYNRGYLNATGSHFLITGMDRLLPDNWLLKIKTYFERISSTGVISIYAPPVRQRDDYRKSRYHCQETKIRDLPVQSAIPFEARICSKEFFHKVGFLREDFDTYGYEDNEWGMRADRIAKAYGYINYIIPGLNAEHYGSDTDFIMEDGRTHREFKDSFIEKNKAKYEEIEREGFPYYNPYF